MCEAQPGPRCASDTCENAHRTELAYRDAHGPDAPPVHALTSAEATFGQGPSASDLRDSVRDFRSSDTGPEERETIRQFWVQHGIPNQFAAMLRASELDGERERVPLGTLSSTLRSMPAGRVGLRIRDTDYTVYYDEQPSRGDRGEPVPGSVTGDYEVAEGPLIGGKGVVFRQHVSPTGQGSDVRGYAADRVAQFLAGRARDQDVTSVLVGRVED